MIMNINDTEILEKDSVVSLGEEALAAVSGGKTRYIEGYDGKSNIRTGPGREYKSIGVLHRGEDVRYLGDTSVDERGVVWYKVRYNDRDAWVSSMYTKKVSY